METERSETVLFVGGPHHGEQMPYMGPRMAVLDGPLPGSKTAARYPGSPPVACEEREGVTSYTVRELYVSGKLVRVASPVDMPEDDVLNRFADLQKL
jgi:hypothetical protein